MFVIRLIVLMHKDDDQSATDPLIVVIARPGEDRDYLWHPQGYHTLCPIRGSTPDHRFCDLVLTTIGVEAGVRCKSACNALSRHHVLRRNTSAASEEMISHRVTDVATSEVKSSLLSKTNVSYTVLVHPIPDQTTNTKIPSEIHSLLLDSS